MHVEALVIKKTPMREHDQLVVLYCRELGKIAASAKSILKPHSVQALQLDEGNRIICELVPGKGGPIITGAQAVRCFSSAKTSSLRWAAAQFFLQVIDTVVYDDQEDPALFACLDQTLGALDAAGDHEALGIFRQQQVALLAVLGYGQQSIPSGTGRTELDDRYEQIAQRRLGTLTMFYDMLSQYAR